MLLTPFHNRVIDHPAAWTNCSLGGVDALRVEPCGEYFAALDDLWAAVAARAASLAAR